MTDVVTQVTHLPGRAHLRSAQNGNYNIPRALTGFGRRPFSVAGPDTWNSLPLVIRCIVVPSTFKRRLKAELISRAYDVSLDISDDYTASLMLNSSGFASSVVRFYFAFTVFLLYALPPIFLHC